jgi:hypothetical protein
LLFDCGESGFLFYLLILLGGQLFVLFFSQSQAPSL